MVEYAANRRDPLRPLREKGQDGSRLTIHGLRQKGDAARITVGRVPGIEHSILVPYVVKLTPLRPLKHLEKSYRRGMPFIVRND